MPSRSHLLLKLFLPEKGNCPFTLLEYSYQGGQWYEKNCVYNYVTKNKIRYLDVVVYEYNNPKQYCIHYIKNGCYETYDMDDWKPANDKDREMVWLNSNILAEYLQNDVIFLQVNWNK